MKKITVIDGTRTTMSQLRDFINDSEHDFLFMDQGKDDIGLVGLYHININEIAEHFPNPFYFSVLSKEAVKTLIDESDEEFNKLEEATKDNDQITVIKS